MKPIELSDYTAVELLGSLNIDLKKMTAAERLLELGIPGNKTEQYRHFAIKPLLNREYTLAQPQQGDLKTGENTLEIRDGIVTTVPEGVNVTFQTNVEADKEHYDALYYLSHLLAPRYIVLTIESDTDITIAHHLNSEQTLIPYRLIIKTAPVCRVSVYETFDTALSNESLLLYGVDVHVGRDGGLTWIRNQTVHADEAVVIGSHRYDLHSQAELTLQTFDFGTGTAMHLYKNDLADHTESKVSHLLFAAGKARRGNVVNLRHNGIYAKSVHQAKSIIRDKATGIFDGLIRVDHDARYANAKQNSKAILLNDHAFMEAKPQLEIYTDELEASHGSTTGQLDEAALFYLRSRGIELNEARKMLILAFVNEMIAEVQNEALAEKIRDDFEAAYYKG
ncbi:MAG: SufD family Fe-S cluster assembly protein [Sulfurimonadaceae bacterium]